MAKVSLRDSKMEATVVIDLTEAEAGCLDAIVGYGAEPFLRVFKDKLGQSYIRRWEHALPSLFETLRQQLSPVLERVEHARLVFAGTMHAHKYDPRGAAVPDARSEGVSVPLMTAECLGVIVLSSPTGEILAPADPNHHGFSYCYGCKCNRHPWLYGDASCPRPK